MKIAIRGHAAKMLIEDPVYNRKLDDAKTDEDIYAVLTEFARARGLKIVDVKDVEAKN